LFKIVWNTTEVEREILSHENDYMFLSFWTPIEIYVNNVDITGLKEIPEGEITQFGDIFRNNLFLFRGLDLEKLHDKQFHFGSNIDNEVSGGGFKYYIDLDKSTDVLTIRYTNRAIKEYRTLKIPLKDFAEGVLNSTKEMLDMVLKIAPEKREDNNYLSIQMDYETILEWYRNRYGVK